MQKPVQWEMIAHDVTAVVTASCLQVGHQTRRNCDGVCRGVDRGITTIEFEPGPCTI